MKNQIKDILLVWFLVLGIVGLTDSFIKACSAFYRQVIKHGPTIQLQITPDMFLPAERFDCSKPYCSLRKISVPSLPKVETV